MGGVAPGWVAVGTASVAASGIATAWVASGSDGWGSPEAVVSSRVAPSSGSTVGAGGVTCRGSPGSTPATTGGMPPAGNTDGPGRAPVPPSPMVAVGAHHGAGGSVIRRGVPAAAGAAGAGYSTV